MYGPCPNRHNGLYLKNRLEIVSSFPSLKSWIWKKKFFQRTFISSFSGKPCSSFSTFFRLLHIVWTQNCAKNSALDGSVWPWFLVPHPSERHKVYYRRSYIYLTSQNSECLIKMVRITTWKNTLGNFGCFRI